MADTSHDDLLARLTGGGASDGTDPWAGLAASQPKHAAVGRGGGTGVEEEDEIVQEAVDQLVDKLREITKMPDEVRTGAPTPVERVPATPAEPPASSQPGPDEFVPVEPTSLAEAQMTPSFVEGLILKLMLSRGDLTGREIHDHIKLPFRIVDELLHDMKTDQVVVHKGSAPMNDYIYQLTDVGRERARRLAAHCTYFGTVPVSLEHYIEAVSRQSLTRQHPTAADLKRAFGDLLINPKMLRRLGPAINSGRGLFLFGPPGNGKTSMAERVTKAFGQFMWIPRAIGIDGEILRLFDPNAHEEAPLPSGSGLLEEYKVDKRWVRIRRPTVVVGGELTMANLEVALNSSTGISEAPVQLKSNCGTLVIDDFGRQRMSTDELLNRWIVPLEKRTDYLNLANGKKIEVPFDQLVIFSTNLEPKDLVDDAFLRRIPYKIEVTDPSEDEFRDLFKMMAPQLGFEYDDDVVTYVIETHYRATGRPMRCCQPRDLLTQVRNMCLFEEREMELTNDAMDFAVDNYFAVL
ncbi:MAG: AAA family ATPase [Planctomycetota bacterium]|nr:MAG: AAA family ATPase [Planctomycetota bacterium]